MKISVVAVGRLRPPWADDVAHYTKLIAGHARLEVIEVREEDERRSAQRRGPVERRLPERAFVSLLALDGQAYDSIGFSRFIEERRASGRDLCFVIGGAYGLDLERADHRLSLGPATLPHQLARVVLLEQLFRAHKIIAREPYHH
jgi:23S rRNA (pseudouridine1915-N3)-methyltransferase